MSELAEQLTSSLSGSMSSSLVIFIISMIPILELRGGLLAAALLKVPVAKAAAICIVGNIIPIPFLLLFIKKIFGVLKRHTKHIGKLVIKLENRALNKSEGFNRGEFLGLLFFVGIPLPGTGAWTGSLIAALLDMDIKKSALAIFLGILLAATIMVILCYAFPDIFRALLS